MAGTEWPGSTGQPDGTAGRLSSASAGDGALLDHHLEELLTAFREAGALADGQEAWPAPPEEA
jgi:hypothetical protein